MRVFLTVLDGVGAGYQEDAGAYGDVGADTLGHVLEKNPRLTLPELGNMGLFNIVGTAFYAPREVKGCFGRQRELSAGKDTTTGHWEMAGCILSRPFPTFPNGFPEEILAPFRRETGRGVLGNKVASGTQIIQELGERHMKTGDLIVYTSADSVFQVAAHEDIVPLEELYRVCRQARALLAGKYEVGRVIARPFTGTPGSFTRTPDRRDFSVTPPDGHLLQYLSQNGVPVTAIGKISDIFAGSGITRSITAHGNREVMDALLRCAREGEDGFYMANLVDFDMAYGHRRDYNGFGKALEQVDIFLAGFRMALFPDDLLIITADHGCDPTFPGTDHTREFTPLLIWSTEMKQGQNLGTRNGFTGIAATVADFFCLEHRQYGASLFQ